MEGWGRTSLSIKASWRTDAARPTIAGIDRPTPDIVPCIHRLGNSLVNWYVIEQQGRLTVLDAGLPAMRKPLAADLAALHYLPSDVDAVVLTHSDSDHTGVAEALRQAGARVLIHSADAQTLRRPRPKTGDASPKHALREIRRPALWRFFGGMVVAGAARPTKVRDAQTFRDGDVLDIPGSPRVVHTPGHTPGHCAIHFERLGALFVGDALCTRNPLTGALGPQVMPSFCNVSTETCFESLASLEPLEAEVLFPGHGEPWRGNVREAVVQAREAGRT